jgi:mono/diheme cytochrome c family protein
VGTVGRLHKLVAVLIGLGGCGGPAAPGLVEPPEAPAGARATEPVPAFYTAEQAERGRRVFSTLCATCHGRNEFTGPIFALTWMAEPVGHLFEHISTAMPQDDPGSLTPEEYAAVVAYMLELNGRAAGERAMPADAEALGRLTW